MEAKLEAKLEKMKQRFLHQRMEVQERASTSRSEGSAAPKKHVKNADRECENSPERDIYQPRKAVNKNVGTPLRGKVEAHSLLRELTSSHPSPERGEIGTRDPAPERAARNNQAGRDLADHTGTSKKCKRTQSSLDGEITDDDDDALSLTCSDEELWQDIEAELDDREHTCTEVTKSLAEVTNKSFSKKCRRKAERNV